MGIDEREHGAIPGTQAGDHVGLGRVVENRASIGSPDDDDPVTPGTHTDVDEASAESFPASDPPTFMSDTATPADRGATTRSDEGFEAPRPDEVP